MRRLLRSVGRKPLEKIPNRAKGNPFARLALGAGAGHEGKSVLAELRIGLARVHLERLRLDAGLGGIDGLAVLFGHADDAQLAAPVGRQLDAKRRDGRGLPIS